MINAWMLRQDGSAYPVKCHLYCMGDDDLSSEAEVAAFLISTSSKDIELAKEVIVAWVALGIESIVKFDSDADGIQEAISQFLSGLPYKFQYPLKTEEILYTVESSNCYKDTGELYDFIDSLDISSLQKRIKDSVNQQFSRVRYGGCTNSTGTSAGPAGSIWCRVSSLGYNWANTFYKFITDNRRKLHIQSVFICRDYESDNGDDLTQPEYFYKAKDGAVYYNMPIDEYLQEEHEHSVVFSSNRIQSGYLPFIRRSLAYGDTIQRVLTSCSVEGVSVAPKVWNNILLSELKECVQGSEYMDKLGTRSKMKIYQIIRKLEDTHEGLTISDVTSTPRENRSGKPVGFCMEFELRSDNKSLDGQCISVVFSKPFNTIPAGAVIQMFNKELSDFCEYKHIAI